MIQVNNVSKKYGKKLVVDQVDLNLEKGKIISLIGPNGAGKSTLLGMMSRTLKKDGGSILIDGRAITDWETIDLAKVLAIMKQSEHISIKISVRDLIAFGRYPYSEGKLTQEDQAIIQEAIDYLDLHDIADAYIDELSGGQRQRAFIASIYAQSTDYILLDEPLNNLDIKHAANMLTLLKKMAHEQNKTIIIVIHDINFASSFSDHIVLMDQGRVVQSDTVERVMQPEILEAIYGMPFEVIEVKGKRLCIYY